MLYYAITTKDTKHQYGPTAIHMVTLPAGKRVTITPASNLPESSPIKWWLNGWEPDGLSVEQCNRLAMARETGVGLHADDIDLQ